jgi:hypothetical protein
LWPFYNRQYIDTLIECEQKMVISEYVVQQYLKEIWNGQVSDIWNGEDIVTSKIIKRKVNGI